MNKLIQLLPPFQLRRGKRTRKSLIGNSFFFSPLFPSFFDVHLIFSTSLCTRNGQIVIILRWDGNFFHVFREKIPNFPGDDGARVDVNNFQLPNWNCKLAKEMISSCRKLLPVTQMNKSSYVLPSKLQSFLGDEECKWTEVEENCSKRN